MVSSKAIGRAILAIAASAAGTAWAHPGHGEPGSTATLLHLLTEPDHLLALVAAIGIGAWAVGRTVAGRRAPRKHREG